MIVPGKRLKSVPTLQIDALFQFGCSTNDLSNGAVDIAFLLLLGD